jgi:hypothetical protein
MLVPHHIGPSSVPQVIEKLGAFGRISPFELPYFPKHTFIGVDISCSLLKADISSKELGYPI